MGICGACAALDNELSLSHILQRHRCAYLFVDGGLRVRVCAAFTRAALSPEVDKYVEVIMHGGYA